MDRLELTDREVEITKLAASGRTNPEIAAELELSVATVKRHLANVMLKWNVQNRTRVAIEAIRRGVVSQDELGLRRRRTPKRQSGRRPQKRTRLKG